VRTAAGTIASFDPPASIRTYAYAVHNKGTVTGFYQDASDLVHGFTRAADGTITPFDMPEAAVTFAYVINDKGRDSGKLRD
jgi:hypothetical protein